MTASIPASQTPARKQAQLTQTWLLARSSERLIIATDPRELPVKRYDEIPATWLSRDERQLSEFKGKSQPGEFLVFQVSIYNNGEQPVTIASTQFNMGTQAQSAVNLNEAVSTEPGKHITILPKHLQPIWLGVQFNEAGTYKGQFQAEVALGESGYFTEVKVPVQIVVEGASVPNDGVDEGWRLSRLKWLLPSNLGVSDTPTKGYLPLSRRGREIHLTGTSLTLDPCGLPEQIVSQDSDRQKMLHSPVQFQVHSMGKPLLWHGKETEFTSTSKAKIEWRNVRESDQARLTCEGSVEFDGFVRYRMLLKAKRRLDISDVRLSVPYLTESASYQLGLGFKGGFTPQSTNWKWNVALQQDCVWLGTPSVGAQWRFKGSNYIRPLVNIYYGFRPLNLPESWGNQGKGGIKVHLADRGVRLLEATSGDRVVEEGDQLEFNFDVQLTPARPLDTDKQWSTRFYHPNELSPAAKIDEAVDTAKAAGANVINIHHRKPINPFINYPFNDFSVPDLKEFIKSAHDQNMRVKLYYTTRELTWQLPEIWALKSFGGSIIQPGPGPGARTVINPSGAHPLLSEALRDSFIPAWTAVLDGKYAGKQDLAVITKPDSAWSNYYLHGLEWLTTRAKVDGVYIDDTALDRMSLQRARRILEATRPSPLIDLHSWNHEDPLAAQGSSTSIYMELFPYMDRIWLGEGFDYEHATPDYWLVSMSGLPYGVMSEMLQGGGNVWRGMLFGETSRLGWSGDPRSMWKFWDQFGMSGTHMIGWWDKHSPVRTDSKDVLATVYRKPGKALIAIANWTNLPKEIHLAIDWKSLGIDPTKAKIVASAIEGFQEEASWKVGEPITVPGGKGWVITVQ